MLENLPNRRKEPRSPKRGSHFVDEARWGADCVLFE